MSKKDPMPLWRVMPRILTCKVIPHKPSVPKKTDQTHVNRPRDNFDTERDAGGFFADEWDR